MQHFAASGGFACDAPQGSPDYSCTAGAQLSCVSLTPGWAGYLCYYATSSLVYCDPQTQGWPYYNCSIVLFVECTTTGETPYLCSTSGGGVDVYCRGDNSFLLPDIHFQCHYSQGVFLCDYWVPPNP
jgi:hypothetical protein